MNPSVKQTPEWGKKMIQGIMMAAALGIMAAGMSIPFLFESPSLYYKLGMDKAMLQTGKSAGLLAAVLILFQVVFVSRLFFLTQAFSLKTLYVAHRFSGKMILALVLVHGFCILASENFVFFSLEKRYWPEFLGMGLLGMISGIVLGSIKPSLVGVSQKRWSCIHRWTTPLAVFLVFVHVRFVSESFDFTIPRIGLGIAACAALALFTRIYHKRITGR